MVAAPYGDAHDGVGALPPSEGSGGKPGRVTQRAAYLRIQSRGARVHTSHFVILVLARSDTDSSIAQPARRLGITITKKTARRAVDRNRVKRVVRELFRRRPECFPVGCDVVFVAKPRAWELGYAEVENEVERARKALLAAARDSRSRLEADR